MKTARLERLPEARHVFLPLPRNGKLAKGAGDIVAISDRRLVRGVSQVELYSLKRGFLGWFDSRSLFPIAQTRGGWKLSRRTKLRINGRILVIRSTLAEAAPATIRTTSYSEPRPDDPTENPRPIRPDKPPHIRPNAKQSNFRLSDGGKTVGFGSLRARLAERVFYWATRPTIRPGSKLGKRQARQRQRQIRPIGDDICLLHWQMKLLEMLAA